MREYPGLGRPLRYFSQGGYPTGIHGNCHGGDSEILTVREVAMMIIMDALTDKPDWHKKVFDDEIIAKWRKEALEYPDDSLWNQAVGGKARNRWPTSTDPDVYGITPLKGIMSNEAFDHCVQELRNKARYYEKSGLIPTLDACASVVKSDSLISPGLQAGLRAAFNKLKAEQADSPDWHPNSHDMVQDLLHPSMYPLVYGRSKGFEEEVVGVSDAVEKWAGKGQVIEKDDYQPDPNLYHSYGVGGDEVPPNFWSDTYQWLPSNLAFQDDGSVKFTSYINNLHPNKHPEIYLTIEKLVETVLPAWDQCLTPLDIGYTKIGAGRTFSRFPRPDHPDDENPENWDPPQPGSVEDDDTTENLSTEMVPFGQEIDDEPEDEFEDPALRRWKKTRRPVQLEPNPFEDPDDFYVPKENMRLSEKFKQSGLQIIVKMASIELTPEKREFPIGGWHVEGQMNEHICATALYYLDSENITSSNLSFRMQTSAYLNEEYEDVGQDSYNWLEHIYGTNLGGGDAPCLQNYGSVETKEGRLLTFPNIFQHRVSPFRLADPTKPGHRRFIALWLVDPHVRVISTANVPPQQLNWWAEAIFANYNQSIPDNVSKLPAELAHLLEQRGVSIDPSEIEKATLPPELKEMLRENLDKDGSLLMSAAEARKHRESLMNERTAFSLEADDQWHDHTYSFCEH